MARLREANTRQSVKTIGRYGYVPQVVLMVGTGEGNEWEVFKEAWPDVDVRGIEAHPKTAELAGRKFNVINAAVVQQDHGGRVSFYMRYRSPKRSSLHSRGAARDTEIKVATIPLAGYARSHALCGTRIWLWMDCEGCELGAIMGGMELMKSVGWIQIETVEASGNRPSWPVASEVIPVVESMGYEVAGDYRRKKRTGRCGDMLYRRTEGNEK